MIAAMPAGGAAPEPTIEELARAVDRAAAAVRELEPAAREAAEELRRAVEAAHRAGLVAIVRALRADERGRELLFELVDEPAVHLLLSLHGIIRPDPATLVRAELARIRPYLAAAGADVELVRVERSADNVTAVIRIIGGGGADGCATCAAGGAAEQVAGEVAEALLARVPVITAVEVDEPQADQAPTVIPLGSLFSRIRPAPSPGQMRGEPG
ncbi:MAG: NifU family protein [Frankia sp.]|nr:NifU family protein [Frankia sp.]